MWLQATVVPTATSPVADGSSWQHKEAGHTATQWQALVSRSTRAAVVQQQGSQLMQCRQQCYVLGLLWGQCNNLMFSSEIASMILLDDFCFIIGFML